MHSLCVCVFLWLSNIGNFTWATLSEPQTLCGAVYTYIYSNRQIRQACVACVVSLFIDVHMMLEQNPCDTCRTYAACITRVLRVLQGPL